MVAYSIGIIPLIKQLKAEFPDINQPWYYDCSGPIVMFTSVKLYFNFLKRFGPYKGITQKHIKVFWLCIRTISNPEIFWLVSRV